MAKAFMWLFSPREHRVSSSSAFRRMLASVHFALTVRAALRHESVDSGEERDGLGCHLGQGLGCDIADMYVCEC